MTEIIFIIKESAEGGFEAKALDCFIYTEAKDMESLKKAVIEGKITEAEISSSYNRIKELKEKYGIKKICKKLYFFFSIFIKAICVILVLFF